MRPSRFANVGRNQGYDDPISGPGLRLTEKLPVPAHLRGLGLEPVGDGVDEADNHLLGAPPARHAMGRLDVCGLLARALVLAAKMRAVCWLSRNED